MDYHRSINPQEMSSFNSLIGAGLRCQHILEMILGLFSISGME